ncbi:MAG: S8 family serine peptidase, partial [Planctomycetota bacterium]
MNTFQISSIALVALSTFATAQDVTVVLLEQPQTLPGSEDHLTAVDELQDAVLDRLEAFGADVDPRYRYENFAAFSAVLDETALGVLESDPLVVRFGSDMAGKVNANTAVPFLRGDLAHELGGGVSRGEGVVIGVLDSGVDTDHIDLVSSIAPGAFRFTMQGADTGPGAEDGLGHGTNVTGIIASDGLLAPRGIAPSAQILPVQVVASNGQGWLSDWAAGIDYAITQKNGPLPGLSILNMSLGTNSIYSEC